MFARSPHIAGVPALKTQKQKDPRSGDLFRNLLVEAHNWLCLRSEQSGLGLYGLYYMASLDEKLSPCLWFEIAAEITKGGARC